MQVNLDYQTHKYTVDGIEYPSVTQCLKAANFYNYGGVNADVLARAAQFGRAVHHACALDDQNNLGEAHEALMPYLEAWRRFKLDYAAHLKFMVIEQPLFSQMYGFCGMPDRGGALVKDRQQYGIVVDIKTGQHEDWHEVQCAGYELLLCEHWKGLGFPRPKLWEHWVVHLEANKYKIEVVDRTNMLINRKTFLAAVQICHWKRLRKEESHDASN